MMAMVGIEHDNASSSALIGLIGIMSVYQWLARRWQSHQQVTLLVWAINLGWLLPMAWLCTEYPEQAVLFAGIALAPLVPLGLFAGAGRAEQSTDKTYGL
jgi:hypothetical protein